MFERTGHIDRTPGTPGPIKMIYAVLLPVYPYNMQCIVMKVLPNMGCETALPGNAFCQKCRSSRSIVKGGSSVSRRRQRYIDW